MGLMGPATVEVDLASSCFHDELSGPADLAGACSTTVRSGSWRVENGELVGTSAGEEAWAWAGSPPAEALPGAAYSLEIQFLSRPPTELGRHGGIMFCAKASTSRWDAQNSGYTLDWIDRMQDHGLRFIRFRNGNAESMAVGGGHREDPPAAWRVELDAAAIRCFGDGQLLLEVEDAEFRRGFFETENGR